MNTSTFDTIDTLESLPAKIEYVCRTKKDEWECDQWRVTISSNKGFHSFDSFDYFTGLGLREKLRGARAINMRERRFVKGQWEATKPKAPSVADVFAALITDASAAEESFNDWCANYGYSDDSIKAMAIYKSCRDTADVLRKHFSQDTLRELRELLQDY